MENIITILEELLKISETNNHHLGNNKLFLNNKQLLRSYKCWFNDNTPLNEILYCYKHNIETCPTCICGSNFLFKQDINAYSDCCIARCTFSKNQTTKRIKQAKLEKYGDENYNNQEKVIQTNLEKYGVDYNFKSKILIEKRKHTCLEKYGVENVNQNKNIYEKGRQTKIKKYNNPNYVNHEKTKQTKFERYGDENYNNQEKSKQTCLERYGVEHQMHVSEFHEKTLKYRWKEYIMPSGKSIKVQGYEPQALDFLLTKYTEDEIISSRKEIPKIWYFTDNGNSHRYYPDFYIPKENLIIEVKSTYTVKCDIEKNLLKKEATINSGYEYQLLIF